MTQMRIKYIIGLSALLCITLLQPDAASAGPNDKALNTAITRIFGPYKLEDNRKAIWDQPFFSVSARQLIREWQPTLKNDEVSDLSSGDWLCQCQDYDFAAFKVTRKSYKTITTNKVRATITMDLGSNEKRKTDLILVRERGQWEIDDVISTDFPNGVKSALKAEIEAAKKR